MSLLREAVSNSVDADAKHIDVQLNNAGGEMWNVVIQDDGNGMEDKHMRAFFNAGDSVKDFAQTAIGEKGLGSKTTFVAKEVVVESRRYTNPGVLLVGRMQDPMASLAKLKMPKYTVEQDPAGHTPGLTSAGTRITLAGVHFAAFNGRKTADAKIIADRVMHYLRSMCATGTVKNRHGQQTHVIKNVANVGVIPLVTVEVATGNGTVTLGPEPGVYQVPSISINPTNGPMSPEGVQQNSKRFCDVLDFNRSRTITIGGNQVTVHYDGTAVIAGENVRAEMLKHEPEAGLDSKVSDGGAPL
ncbi:hypothetical protein GCM10025868_27300 [Angustibacter aerolatus]|uniref:Histidine kinase/HSP90-like ATPase domain-containing protein n=1 Tax=Angustibacter aerolatus TaxID=1162965 RepID=A0ABQ6JGZ4_9ACTN|nr:ATP-binding protein [Angustibacter aerolatus]GMA87480.1 hypothetical protein GCM10025868_27300 [Angustibacter aerolatus]